jgi:sugar lactone lactonase YvrE
VSEVEHVLSVQNELGEGPIWSPDEHALYWVDIQNRLIYRYYPATGAHESFEISSRVTVLAPRASGGFVVGTDTGFASWDPQTQEVNFIANPEADRPYIRFNDGAVDAQGRFWAGTMNDQEPAAPDGSIYRLDPDGSVHKMATGFTVSNGTAWSPDHKTMYFTDTFRQMILAFDYDPESGSISNQRPYVRVPEEDGYPDGHTVDSEGFVWSTHWGGWKVTRYDPTGKVEREIRLPAPNVTSCAFGGENLDELYITTAWATMSEEDRKKHPLAGDLFRVRVGIKGMEQPKFAG